MPEMGHQQYVDNIHSENSLPGEILTRLGILKVLSCQLEQDIIICSFLLSLEISFTL